MKRVIDDKKKLNEKDRQLLEQGYPVALNENLGEIPLPHKFKRITEGSRRGGQPEGKYIDPSLTLQDVITFTSFGYVDPSQLEDLVKLVKEGYHLTEEDKKKQATPPKKWYHSISPLRLFFVAIVLCVLYSHYVASGRGGSTWIFLVAAFPLFSFVQTKTDDEKEAQELALKEEAEQKKRASSIGSVSLKKLNQRRFTASDVKSPTNLWDEANATVNNAAIWREQHDDWGIGKVVFIFCDPYMRQIYEMPWWHARPDIRQAMKPILEDKLGCSCDENGSLDGKYIIRMFLASLPPGDTIGIHYDTYEWVKYTHRVHVPIISTDSSNILFRVGISHNQLKRIDCRPGHVFELNNRCYHTVSNCTDDSRVHLILDYVHEEDLVYLRNKYHGQDPQRHPKNSPEQTVPPTVKVQPGEYLIQTMRSIDETCDIGTRTDIPMCTVLTAPGGGAQYLHQHLNKNPLVNMVRDSHMFDWEWPAKLGDAEKIRQHIRNTYFQYEAHLQYYPSFVTMDCTPTYLIDSKRIIPRIQQICHGQNNNWNMKFLVILRNPVNRAIIQYMTDHKPQRHANNNNNMSLLDVAKQDMQHMKDCGLLPYWDIETGTHDSKVFEEFAGSPEESQAWETYVEKHVPYHQEQYSIIARGLYELNLRPWLKAFNGENNKKNPFCVIHLEKQCQTPNVNLTCRKMIYNHICLPMEEENFPFFPLGASKFQIDPEAQHYLETFYEPHNKRLGQTILSMLEKIEPTTTATNSDEEKKEEVEDFYASCWKGSVWE